MLDDKFKKSAIEKVTAMSANELKKAFKEIGSEPETNEEWLKSLDTELLAEWIVHLADDCTMQHECNLCNSWCDEKRVMEWLKQPHREE